MRSKTRGKMLPNIRSIRPELFPLEERFSMGESIGYASIALAAAGGALLMDLFASQVWASEFEAKEAKDLAVAPSTNAEIFDPFVWQIGEILANDVSATPVATSSGGDLQLGNPTDRSLPVDTSEDKPEINLSELSRNLNQDKMQGMEEFPPYFGLSATLYLSSLSSTEGSPSFSEGYSPPSFSTSGYDSFSYTKAGIQGSDDPLKGMNPFGNGQPTGGNSPRDGGGPGNGPIPTNTPPVALDDSYSATWNTSLIVSTGGVLANDYDLDNDPITAVLVDPPEHGTLGALNADGTFTYTPNTDYAGPDRFTYLAFDGQAYSEVATVVLTVNTDNVVGIAVDPQSASELGVPAIFTITRSGSVTNPLKVYYTLSGTATPGQDFNNLPGFIEIESGQTQATITIDPVDDYYAEGTEGVTISLASNQYYSISASSQASASIRDDLAGTQSIVNLSLAITSTTESSNTIPFVVTRTGSTSQPLTVRYSAGGTAVSGLDYAALSGTVTIPVGSASAPVNVQILDDSWADGEKTLVLSILEQNASYRVGDQITKSLSMLDNFSDIAPVISLTQLLTQVSEGAGNTSFVELGMSGQGTVTIPYTVTVTPPPGGVSNPVSFSGTVAVSNSSSFSFGPITFSTITGNVLENALAEGTYQVTIELTPSSSYLLLDTKATFLVIDNDTFVSTEVVGSLAVGQAEQEPAGFLFNRVGNTSNDLIVSYTVGGSAVPGVDYERLSGQIVIPAGSSSALLPIRLLPNTSIGSSIQITAQSGGEYQTSGSSTCRPIGGTGPCIPGSTITEYVTIDAPDNQAIEPQFLSCPDDGIFHFKRIVYDGNQQITPSWPLTVRFRLLHGGGSDIATPTYDYYLHPPVAPNGTTPPYEYSITFPANVTDLYYDVEALSDTVCDDNERAQAVLYKLPTDTYTILNSTAIITIREMTVDIYASPATIAEPGCTTYFSPISTVNVKRTADPCNLPLSVVVGIPKTDPAMLGIDYTLLNALGQPIVTSGDANFHYFTVTIPAGQLSTTFTVHALQDIIFESSESANFKLFPNTAPGNLYDLCGEKIATVTIEDSTPVVSVQSPDPYANEPMPIDNGTFRFTRNCASTSLVVTFDMVRPNNNAANRPADPNPDYSLSPNAVPVPGSPNRYTITFNAGVSVIDVELVPIQDGIQESTESTIARIVSSVNYRIGYPEAYVSIGDNQPPTVCIAAIDPVATEILGPPPTYTINTGMYRITRTGPTTNPLAVSFAMYGEAEDGPDYSLWNANLTSILLPSGSSYIVTIPANQTYVDFALVPFVDSTPECIEDAIALLNYDSPDQYLLCDTPYATVNIYDSTIELKGLSTVVTNDPGNLCGCVSLAAGNATTTIPLPIGGTVTCACGQEPGSALKANSTLNNDRPTVQIVLDTSGDCPVPVNFRATISWDGTAAVQLNNLNRNESVVSIPYDQYVGLSTGRHTYQVTLTALAPDGTVLGSQLFSGYTYSIGAGLLGPSWSIGFLDNITPIPAGTAPDGSPMPAGYLMGYGAGGFRFFESTPTGNANQFDHGTLTSTGTGYTYRNREGVTTNFDANGQFSSWVSADQAKTASYDTATSTMKWFDGTMVKLSKSPISPNRVSTIEITYPPDSDAPDGTLEGGKRFFTLYYEYSGTAFERLKKVVDNAGTEYLFYYYAPNVPIITRMDIDGIGTGDLQENFFYNPVTFELTGYKPLNHINAINDYTLYKIRPRSLSLAVKAFGGGGGGGGGGVVYKFERPTYGYVTTPKSESMPLGETTTYEFDRFDQTEYDSKREGWLTGVKSPQGTWSKYNYHFVDPSNPNPALAKIVDRLQIVDDRNRVTTMYFGADGNKGMPLSIAHPDNTSEYFTYIDIGNRKLVERHWDQRRNITFYGYDPSNGDINKVIVNEAGLPHERAEWTFAWSSQITGGIPTTNPGIQSIGDLLYVIDPNGNRTNFSYDKFGRQTGIFYGRLADNSRVAGEAGEVQNKYNSTNDIRQVGTRADRDNNTDPYRTFRYTFDGMGRVLSVQQPDQLNPNPSIGGPITYIDYTTTGLVNSVTLPPANPNSTLSQQYNYQYTGLWTDNPPVYQSRHTVSKGGDDGQGQVQTIYYDGMNRPVKYDQDGRWVKIDYINTNINDPILGEATVQQIKTTTTIWHPNNGYVDYTSYNNYWSTGEEYSSINHLGLKTVYNYLPDDSKVDVYLRNTSDALLQQYSYHLSPTGQVDSYTNQHNDTTTITFDNLERPYKVSDPLYGPQGLFYYSEFDKLGNVTKSTDLAGLSTVVQYNSFYQPKVISQQPATPAGTTDEAAFRRKYWRSSTVNYNHNGLPTSMVGPDPDGPADPGFPSSNPRKSIVTNYSYTNWDQVKSVTESDGSAVPAPGNSRTSQFTYNNVGDLIKTIDPLSRETTYVRDAFGRLTQLKTPDPDGAGVGNPELVWKYTYDRRDNVTSVTAPPQTVGANGPVTTYAYDGLDRITQIVLPGADTYLGGTTAYNTPTYDYSYSGTNVTVFGPYPEGFSGSAPRPQTDYTYDLLGRITQVQQPSINLGSGGTSRSPTLYSYNDAARQVTITRPDPDLTGSRQAMSTTNTMDALGRTTSSTDTAGSLTRTTSATYTPANLVATVTPPDPDGTATAYASWITNYTYDPLHRLAKVNQADPDGAGPSGAIQNSFDYDLYDLVTKVTDSPVAANGTPNGNTTSYNYDLFGRLSTDTNQLGHTRSYSYDLADRLTTYIDRNGRKSVYAYDNLDRVTSENWYATASSTTSLRTISSTYHLDGRLAQVTDPDATLSYQYNARGEMTQEISAIAGGSSITTNYEYDPLGRWGRVKQFVGSSTTPDHSDTYGWDNQNNLKQIERRIGSASTPSQSVSISYDALGLYHEVKRNNASVYSSTLNKTSYTYDDFGRTTGIAHQNGNGAALATYGYQYLNNDWIKQETYQRAGSSLVTTNYSYDQIGQLKVVDSTDNTLDGTYSWDANGNPVGTNITVGVNNRLLSDAQYSSYSYDNEGNRISRTARSGQGGTSATYTWDHRNRLSSVGAGANPTSVSTQKYDPMDRRVAARAGTGAWNYFGYTGEHVSLGLSNATTVNNRYLHGVNTDEVFANERVGTGAGKRWLLTDVRGSVRDVSTATASNATTLNGQIKYDGFGKQVSVSGTTDTLFAYTGRERESASGLQYNRARWYDAGAKRWMSEDPIGFAGGDANLNRYVGNGATNATDHSGLWADEYFNELRAWMQLLPNGKAVLSWIEGQNATIFTISWYNFVRGNSICLENAGKLSDLSTKLCIYVKGSLSPREAAEQIIAMATASTAFTLHQCGDDADKLSAVFQQVQLQSLKEGVTEGFGLITFAISFMPGGTAVLILTTTDIKNPLDVLRMAALVMKARSASSVNNFVIKDAAGKIYTVTRRQVSEAMAIDTVTKESLRFAEKLRETCRKVPAASSVIVDARTGKIYHGISGGMTPDKIHPYLQQKLNEIAKIAKERGLKGDHLERWKNVTNCAEFQTMNRALIDGANIDDLFIHTMRPGGDFGPRVLERCNNCKIFTNEACWISP